MEDGCADTGTLEIATRSCVWECFVAVGNSRKCSPHASICVRSGAGDRFVAGLSAAPAGSSAGTPVALSSMILPRR
jgi:hypothetical protein